MLQLIKDVSWYFPGSWTSAADVGNTAYKEQFFCHDYIDFALIGSVVLKENTVQENTPFSIVINGSYIGWSIMTPDTILKGGHQRTVLFTII